MVTLDHSIHSLREAGAADPTVRSLAVSLAEVLTEAADPVWDRSAAALPVAPPAAGRPLLHDHEVVIDPERVRRLLARLVEVARQEAEAALAGRDQIDHLDVVALAQAGITWDETALLALAEASDLPLAPLATLAHLISLPPLLACGRRVAPVVSRGVWTQGYCPCCAAWPTLAELRGLERQHWLCCGRCGTSWRFRHQECPFCANQRHETLGYLAAEGQAESRRAATCANCQSYLKAVATVGPLTPPEVLLRDLTTLELDITALEQGYGRPDRPGFSLAARVVAEERRSGWRTLWR